MRNGFLKLPKISVSPEVRQPYDVWRSSIKKKIHETNFFHHECLARCLENTGKVIKNVIILCSMFYELSKWAFNFVQYIGFLGVKTEGGGQLVKYKLVNAHILPVVFLSDAYQMELIWRKSADPHLSTLLGFLRQWLLKTVFVDFPQPP